MRFALLGNHPDGLTAARALVATGRHELKTVYDAPTPDFAVHAEIEADLEEILADPAIELAIVAVPISKRGDVLRRAVQSERHVLCVMPCGLKPDTAYEAALIRDDTKKALLPLSPDLLHPATASFALAAKGFRLLVQEVRTSASVSSAVSWNALRVIGGEIAEVAGFATEEKWDPAKPALFHGRFESGALFQVFQLPADVADQVSFRAFTPTGEITLNDDVHRPEPWDDWQALAIEIEAACIQADYSGPLTWQSAIRSAELDDALRRSIEKRRASGLDYQEISEDVGSKGTLTLIGCGMIWMILLVFAVSIWIPWARWAVVPMILGFLILLGVNRLAKKPAEPASRG